jgi:multidrug efflux pump subunit AcrB
MNRLAIFSLRNRALIALVTVVVAIFGGIAMSLLKLELIPSITFPQLVVVTNYPGASPVIVEKEVSTPIETAIQGVNGLEATTATSQNGLSQITAEFAYGTSLESAEQKVQIAINRISSLLPAGVEPQVIAGSFSDIPVLQMAVTSDLTPDQLNQALKDIAVRELTKLDGVREAAVFGANGEHIAIVPNAKKLARLGLTTTDIQTALQTAGIRIGAGSVMSDTGELSIVSGTPLASLSDIRSVPVAIPFKPPVVVAPTVPTFPTIAVSPRETGNWSWDELNGGECIDYDALPATENAFQDSYTVVACADPHDAQLVRVGDLRTDAGIPVYPGDGLIGPFAGSACSKPGIIKASAKVAYPLLNTDIRYPTSQTQWNKGNTFYYCFAQTFPISDITGSVAGKKVNTIVPAAPSASGSSLSSFASSGAAAAPTTRSVTTIGALASVSIQPDTITSISRVNGEPSLTLAITKRADANTVDVSRTVTAALPAITALLGNGTEFTVVFDQAPFIEKSIESLAVEGLLGLFFAIIVILVFLLSIRSTLVTAVSIPTSLLLTFIGMWASNFSLNILTIGAVTISIGRVVDDSIVVVENIKRHLSLGEERMVAIRDGVKEVATAVTASTITTVAVFLPLGVRGRIVRRAVPAVRRHRHDRAPRVALRVAHHRACSCLLVPRGQETAKEGVDETSQGGQVGVGRQRLPAAQLPPDRSLDGHPPRRDDARRTSHPGRDPRADAVRQDQLCGRKRPVDHYAHSLDSGRADADGPRRGRRGRRSETVGLRGNRNGADVDWWRQRIRGLRRFRRKHHLPNHYFRRGGRGPRAHRGHARPGNHHRHGRDQVGPGWSLWFTDHRHHGESAVGRNADQRHRSNHGGDRRVEIGG